ncbi:hypothetical protein ES707_05819 [subsurface metagenome]
MHAIELTPRAGVWHVSHLSDRKACFAESGPGWTDCVSRGTDDDPVR